MKRAALIFLAVHALTVPLQAIAGEPAKADDKANPDRVVCKKIKSTGSLTRVVKDCRKARDWAELRQQSREATENMQVLRANGAID